METGEHISKQWLRKIAERLEYDKELVDITDTVPFYHDEGSDLIILDREVLYKMLDSKLNYKHIDNNGDLAIIYNNTIKKLKSLDKL